MRGIDTSRIARSISSETPRLTASAPSPTSATTARSGSASSIRRSPFRTSAWSSASRILVFKALPTAVLDLHIELHGDPAARALANRQRRADQLGALAHPPQP